MKITNEHVRCIRERGYVVIDNFLGKELSNSLRNEISTYVFRFVPRFAFRTRTNLQQSLNIHTSS